MRCIISSLTTVFLLGFSTMVHARIGETEAQLVERFGVVQARLSERTLEQGRVYVLGERIVLKRAEWRVTAVLIDGLCAKITYVKTGAWTEQHYRGLLTLNADRWTWNEVVSGAPKWQRTWRREDGLVAKWMYAGGFAIVAQPFVDACEQVRENARRSPIATTAQ